MIIGQIKESGKNNRYSMVLQLIQKTEGERQLCWLSFGFKSIFFSFFLSWMCITSY